MYAEIKGRFGQFEKKDEVRVWWEKKHPIKEKDDPRPPKTRTEAWAVLVDPPFPCDDGTPTVFWDSETSRSFPTRGG